MDKSCFWPMVVGRREGGISPYVSYIGMCRPKLKGWILIRFGLKTGIDFDQFGQKFKVWFSREPQERINIFFKIMKTFICIIHLNIFFFSTPNV